MFEGPWVQAAPGLAAALGGGLLIGLDRERRKGQGPARRAAGIRSFALACVGGALAQAVAVPGLVLLGAALVAALGVLAYLRSRSSADPGLTTELALFITYLVGVLSMQQPALGAGAAAVVAGLLALRERLHRLATERLSEAEVHDALLLAALVLVLLPLLPDLPWAWLGGTSPRQLLFTAVLILLLQAAGHIGLRLAGARAGLALSGLLSGFVSSTATIASLGARQKAEPALRDACVAGALLSTAATWLQVLLLVAALAPTGLTVLLPVAAAGALVALLSALPAWRGAQGAAAPPAAGAAAQGPLRLREALLVAGLLTVVSAGVAWAQGRFGAAGLMAGSFLAALADAHAPVAALAGLFSQGSISAGALQWGAVCAVGANALTRSATALAAGGGAYALRVGGSLALSTAAAATLAGFM